MAQVTELAAGKRNIIDVHFDHLLDILCEKKKFVNLCLKIGNNSRLVSLSMELFHTDYCNKTLIACL